MTEAQLRARDHAITDRGINEACVCATDQPVLGCGKTFTGVFAARVTRERQQLVAGICLGALLAGYFGYRQGQIHARITVAENKGNVGPTVRLHNFNSVSDGDEIQCRITAGYPDIVAREIHATARAVDKNLHELLSSRRQMLTARTGSAG